MKVVLHVKEPGRRLDVYLANELPHLSRSRIQRLIRAGAVMVNGQTTRPSYAPLPGDVVHVDLLPETPVQLTAEPIPLDILYEDQDLMVINKPAGMVVHPGAGVSSGTVVHAVLHHRPELAQADPDSLRPGIVHRLDRDTSGVLLIALNKETQRALQKQFKERRITKYYLALVHGHPAPEKAAIDAPIGRDPIHRTRMRIMPEGQGRPARTEYRVLAYLPGSSYIQVHPVTGRTHQIRVHLAAIGHPVLGDALYGSTSTGPVHAPRQMLHAWLLKFRHPRLGELVQYQAPLPEDMRQVLAHLRTQAGY